MNEYDFKMYITEEDGSPVIVMQFGDIETMDEAERLAEELFAIISGEEPEQLH